MAKCCLVGGIWSLAACEDGGRPIGCAGEPMWGARSTRRNTGEELRRATHCWVLATRVQVLPSALISLPLCSFWMQLRHCARVLSTRLNTGAIDTHILLAT